VQLSATTCPSIAVFFVILVRLANITLRCFTTAVPRVSRVLMADLKVRCVCWVSGFRRGVNEIFHLLGC